MKLLNFIFVLVIVCKNIINTNILQKSLNITVFYFILEFFNVQHCVILNWRSFIFSFSVWMCFLGRGKGSAGDIPRALSMQDKCCPEPHAPGGKGRKKSQSSTIPCPWVTTVLAPDSEKEALYTGLLFKRRLDYFDFFFPS